jgi:hypothetical protein
MSVPSEETVHALEEFFDTPFWINTKETRNLLIRKHGFEAYGIYFKIIEAVLSCPPNQKPRRLDIRDYMLIAQWHRLHEERVEVVWDFCLEHGLLEFCENEGGDFWVELPVSFYK